MSAPKKRKALTLEDKKVIIEAAANNNNKTALVKQFNIPRRTRQEAQSAFNLACRYVLKNTADPSILGHSDALDEFFYKERQKIEKQSKLTDFFHVS